MNVISTQQPAQASNPQPPPQSQQPVAAAQSSAPPITQSTLDNAEGPALPSTASWASRMPQTQFSRTSSRSASIVAPNTPPAAPATQLATDPFQDTQHPPQPQPIEATESPSLEEDENSKSSQKTTFERAPEPSPFLQLIRSFSAQDLTFIFAQTAVTPSDFELIKSFPPLFDEHGGIKRRMIRQRDEEERKRLEAEERAALQTMSTMDTDDQMEQSGSLQLGGEPEERQSKSSSLHGISAQPQQRSGLDSFGLESEMSSLGLGGRSLTPQQQQHLLLQQFKSQGAAPPNGFGNQTSGGFSQSPAGQTMNPPGHARNVSRFTFANETSSASTAVKPVANSKLMSQQSSMMPSQGSNGFGGNAPQPSFYTSTVSGPPPGLKATGTPPVSGGGMFGQGHGFATSGLGYGANLTGRNSNDEMMRELLRRREAGGQASDAGKREYISSPYSQSSTSSTPANAPGLLNFPYQSGSFQDANSQKPKKKGKKHRHANTSSSGGGVVDVADPSILQARMHQGGIPGGQGLYPGHGSGALQQQPAMYNGSGGGGFGRW